MSYEFYELQEIFKVKSESTFSPKIVLYLHLFFFKYSIAGYIAIIRGRVNSTFRDSVKNLKASK